MWPEKGSSFHMKSNAASSRSLGTRQATSAPGARFVAMSVCRMRRIVPAASIARRRSWTVATSTLGEARDLGERIDQKARDAILGHGEDARVDRVGDFGREQGAATAIQQS